MKTFLITCYVCIVSLSHAQPETSVVGSVLNERDLSPMGGVRISLVSTQNLSITKSDGTFILEWLPFGKQQLLFQKNGFVTQEFEVNITDLGKIDIGQILMQPDIQTDQSENFITLGEDDFLDDIRAQNAPGLLQATKDVFLRTAAFEFGSSFFRVRGLDAMNTSILINGIKMNKLQNGRPLWSNWGGLNDVMRNQEFVNGVSASNVDFGGAQATTNINIRVSQMRKGASISYASSNRSYKNRVMGSYNSGLLSSGWAYSISLSRRWADQAYVDGSLYDANSVFIGVEKQLGKQQALNIVAMYTPNRRGRTSPITQEIFDLKGNQYNEYWGFQDGEIRNSRERKVVEPIIMLNHFYELSDKVTINTNLSYQFGYNASSRLDYRNTNNPSAAYYRKLPSYSLSRKPINFQEAFVNEQEFIKNGQLNWFSLYEQNIGDTSDYVLYDDRTEDKVFSGNSIVRVELSDKLLLNGKLHFRQLYSDNFAVLSDLLGGENYVNTDTFDNYQYNLLNPDQVVLEGDKFRYHYGINAIEASSFVQLQAKTASLDYFLALSATQTNYQREGFFESEAYQDNSFGKGERLSFLGVSTKAGATFKTSGRHLFQLNGFFSQRAPTISNSFVNLRESNSVVPGIKEERFFSTDASYIFRFPFLNGRLTGFYSQLQNANEVSFYFTDGIGGDTAAFVQEVLQGIEKTYIGAELGFESPITSTLKLKGAVSFGQYTYSNNPNLILSSQDLENGFLDVGRTNLKNYKLANGPQRAYSVGFEYRDPEYWWFSPTVNFFSNAYVDVSPLPRSNNFFLDTDGLPINAIDSDLSRVLLQQEEFEPYMIVNAVGGKSWKVKDYYLGFFASINNILNETYKTGGFEQGRNANYSQLKEDFERERPVFGNKYWFGRGTNFFVGCYVRF
ncbi:TonB-dependent receptor [Spongiivirga sp. MCCC 1A20706]|uniref:carboxypeptidase-like regulatory domain-containing protein n=1 Tax=Spongiivirga sp. MCCC 1A20706 TaxID=3160963 RepID=UPI003977AABD